jgi:hypothetical protein
MLPVCPPLEKVLVPGARLAPGETESIQLATQTATLESAAVTGAGTSATTRAIAATATRSRPIGTPPPTCTVNSTHRGPAQANR